MSQNTTPAAGEQDTSGEPGLAPPDGGANASENRLGGWQDNYRRYQCEFAAPYVGSSMLEVGSGSGDFAARLLPRLSRLVLTDSDPLRVEQLSSRYRDEPRVQVLQLTLPAQVPLAVPVDSVVAINVLEHIDDDVGALRSVAQVTKPGGAIVLWVPAYQQLYGEFDRKIGHVRRYTPKTLSAAVAAAGLSVEVLQPINMLGGIAWWLAVRRGRAVEPKPYLVRTYDRIVIPVTRLTERYIRPPFGQTVFCVARTPEAAAGRDQDHVSLLASDAPREPFRIMSMTKRLPRGFRSGKRTRFSGQSMGQRFGRCR